MEHAKFKAGDIISSGFHYYLITANEFSLTGEQVYNYYDLSKHEESWAYVFWIDSDYRMVA